MARGLLLLECSVFLLASEVRVSRYSCLTITVVNRKRVRSPNSLAFTHINSKNRNGLKHHFRYFILGENDLE